MDNQIPIIKSGSEADLTHAIVKLGASWCGPCKKIKPHFVKLYNGFGTKVNFYEVDIDDYESCDTPLCDVVNTATSIPVIAIFHDSVLIHKVVGTNPTKIDGLKLELDKICPEEEVEDISEIIESQFKDYTREARKVRLADRVPKTADDDIELEKATPPRDEDDEDSNIDMSKHFDKISKDGVVLFDERGVIITGVDVDETLPTDD